MSLLQVVKADPKFKKYRNILKTTRSRLSIEEGIDEIFALHSGRLARRLYGKSQFSPKSILEATAQDLSARSRIAEIRQKTSVQASLLQGAINELHKYVRNNYRSEMRNLSNEASRRAALDAITSSGIELITETETLISTADMVIKDIDQSSHSIRHMISVLDLLSETKGRVA